MNFYKHHIGDYDADTAHLSWTEDMAYTRLMRLYYRRETPIPADIGQACRLVRAATKAEREAVETILNEFFTLEADGWHNKRCDKEVAAAKAKAESNRENGQSGGRPKKTKTEKEPTNNPLGFESDTTKNLLQTPDSRLQKKDKHAALADARAVDGLDVETFDRWVEYRAERKPAIKPCSMVAAAKELAALGERQKDAVNHSIANGYQGLVLPKNSGHGTQKLAPVSPYKHAI